MSKQQKQVSNQTRVYVTNSEYDETNEYQIGPSVKGTQPFNQLPVQQSQSEEGDILQKIDTLLSQQSEIDYVQDENGNKKMTQKQYLLNFKINELQKIIHNLNEANKKMNRKLQEYYVTNHNGHNLQNNNINSNRNNNKQKNNQSSGVLNSSSQSNLPFNDELTQMQGQFQQIQSLITQYKDQLSTSQKRWNTIKQQKDQEIQSLKNQIIIMTQNKQIRQNDVNILVEQNQMLKNRNQQLLLQIQNLEIQLQRRTQQYSQQGYNLNINNTPSNQRYNQNNNYYQPSSGSNNKKYQSFEDYRFNQKIQRQMQNMIKKLLKQLSNQRKINSRMSNQIKRLNNQVIQLQKKMKYKNDNIYQLEMKIIYMQKQYNFTNNIRKNNFNIGNMNGNSNMNMNKYSNNKILVNKSGVMLTPSNNQNKNESRVYKGKYEGKTIRSKQQEELILQDEQQMLLMKQYESNNEYTQYSDQQSNNNYETNQYQDYVLTSIQNNNKISNISNNNNIISNMNNNISNNNNNNNINNLNNLNNNNRSPAKIINKPLNSNNIGGNIKNQIVSTHLNTITSNQPNKNIQNNFIKPKKLPTNQQQSQQLSNITNNKSLSNNPITKQFLTFTLMQLHQGRFKITIKQKIIIISRLIDLYCKKIKCKNYYNLIAEEIQIYNFNQKHPNLIRIRIIDAHSNNSKQDISSTLQQDTQQSLMYNLAFIVQNLVKQVQTIDQKQLEVDLNLAQIIQQILTKSQQDKIAYFQQLSKSLESSVVPLQ